MRGRVNAVAWVASLEVAKLCRATRLFPVPNMHMESEERDPLYVLVVVVLVKNVWAGALLANSTVMTVLPRAPLTLGTIAAVLLPP